MIISALIKKIRTVTGITRVWGTSATPNPAPPYIVINYDGADRVRHFGQGNGYQTGLVIRDFEIMIFDTTAYDAEVLGQTVISALENFTGPITGNESPLQTYNVMDVDITGELIDYDVVAELYYYSIFMTVTTRS